MTNLTLEQVIRRKLASNLADYPYNPYRRMPFKLEDAVRKNIIDEWDGPTARKAVKDKGLSDEERKSAQDYIDKHAPKSGPGKGLLRGIYDPKHKFSNEEIIDEKITDNVKTAVKTFGHKVMSFFSSGYKKPNLKSPGEGTTKSYRQRQEPVKKPTNTARERAREALANARDTMDRIEHPRHPYASDRLHAIGAKTGRELKSHGIDHTTKRTEKRSLSGEWDKRNSPEAKAAREKANSKSNAMEYGVKGHRAVLQAIRRPRGGIKTSGHTDTYHAGSIRDVLKRLKD